MSDSPVSVSFRTGVYKLPHLGGHYLEIPPAVVTRLGGNFNIRLKCAVNGAKAFRCGLVALGEGAGYISLNAARMKSFGLQEGDEAEVTLEIDTDQYGADLPEELEELLRQDKIAQDRFQKLVPGKQRFIIRYVSAVKNPALRLEKALFILSNLKRLPPGRESFNGLTGEKE